MFPDILADVQKKLYEIVSGRLMEDVARPESEQKYLNSLLDRENRTLKGLYEPYFSADNEAEVYHLKDYTKHWFNGFIAKTKACADGTPEITKRYQDMYDAILAGNYREEIKGCGVVYLSKAFRHSESFTSFRKHLVIPSVTRNPVKSCGFLFFV